MFSGKVVKVKRLLNEEESVGEKACIVSMYSPQVISRRVIEEKFAAKSETNWRR